GSRESFDRSLGMEKTNVQRHLHYLKHAAIVFVLVIASRTSRADWPQWRGPHRDGVSTDFVVPAPWPRALKERWTIPVAEGHSSPLLANGKLSLHTRQNNDEVVRCLDAAEGTELWQATYPAPYEMDPAARSHGKGPKSTPTLSDAKLYT